MSIQPSKNWSIVRNGFVYAGVIALGAMALAPIMRALWRVLEQLLSGEGVQVTAARDHVFTDALRIGWAIVAAGLVIACMVILLRLKVRQEDERGPPLAPALAMVAVGAALVAIVSIAR